MKEKRDNTIHQLSGDEESQDASTCTRRMNENARKTKRSAVSLE